MGLVGVTFDNIDTYGQWNFFLVTRIITPPKPKIYKVDVPGGNGSLDLTESVFGRITYEDRNIYMKFRSIGSVNLWDVKRTQILEALHGRRAKIIFDDEQSYFYEGRITITSFTYNKDIAEMEIEADCDPFKYEISNMGQYWLWDPFDFILGEIAEDEITVSGITETTITVKMKPICPMFRANSQMTLIYNGLQKTIPANRNISFYDIYLTEGNHTFTLNGNGKIKISYNNGVL